MVILEQINSKESSNIQWVVNEAMKMGSIKSLDEVLRDSKAAVIVAKVRELRPVIINHYSEHRIESLRVMILKEVLVNGSYGNKFKAFLFGSLATDSEKAKISIGDRLIFVQPYVVRCSMYEQPAHLSKLQVECGLAHHNNQRLILVVKKFEQENMEVNVPGHTLSESVDKSISRKQNENEGNIENVGSELIQDVSGPSNESDSGKQIAVLDKKYIRNNNYHAVTNKSQNICETKNYLYKKIADVKDTDHKVNVYFVVAQVLKVQYPVENRRGYVTLIGVDETCKDRQHVVVRIMFDQSDTTYKHVQPRTIMRVHRMTVVVHYGNVYGLVFRGSDYLIFPFLKKSKITAISSSKCFTFTNSDQDRLNEIKQWLNLVYVPSQTSCEVNWRTLIDIKPDEIFQIHCRVEGRTLCSDTEKLILHVSDGTTCPLRLYKIPLNKNMTTEEAGHFLSRLKVVDVIVEKPSETTLKLQKGDVIVLGPIKLTQCEIVDRNDPNCYKMNLLDKGEQGNVKILNSVDPAVKAIKKRLINKDDRMLLPTSVVQSTDEKVISNLILQSNQKDGVREKRKLFYVNDNIDHTESKRKKSDLSELVDFINENKVEEEPSNEVRIKSPFEDEMFNFIKTGTTDVYSEKLNPDPSTAKQLGNLKKKNVENKIQTVAEFHESTQLSLEKSAETEISDKATLINELKTKRIDTMSQESVDKYFEELTSVITKKYVLPRNKQSGPGSDAVKAVPKENLKTSPLNSNNLKNNPEILTLQLSSSSSSSDSSLVVMDVKAEASKKLLDKPQNCISNDKDNVENSSEQKVVYIKLVKLPPGQKGQVVMKDDMVLVEIGDKGFVNDADQITLLSLCEAQLKTNRNENSSTDSKEENNIAKSNNSTFGQDMSKICENLATSPIDQFTLKKSKIKNVCDNSFRGIINTAGHMKPSSSCPTLNKSNHTEISAVDVDICDTVIQENVSVVSSSATTIKNNKDKERHNKVEDQLPKSLNSVENWLSQSDCSVSIKAKDSSAEHSSKEINDLQLFMEEEDLFHVVDMTCKLNVFVMDIQPNIKDEPLELVSGYCFSSCHKLYLLSTLLWLSDIKSILCPKCYEEGEMKKVELIFAVQLMVMDQTGNQNVLFVLRQHAEQFFGCTVKEYLQSQKTRTRVIKTLSKLKYNGSKTFVPLITMSAVVVDNQMFLKDTKLKSV